MTDSERDLLLRVARIILLHDFETPLDRAAFKELERAIFLVEMERPQNFIDKTMKGID